MSILLLRRVVTLSQDALRYNHDNGIRYGALCGMITVVVAAIRYYATLQRLHVTQRAYVARCATRIERSYTRVTLRHKRSIVSAVEAATRHAVLCYATDNR